MANTMAILNSSRFLLIFNIFTLHLHGVLSGFAQHFESSPSQNYTSSKGNTLRIPCVVRNRRGECLWLHNGVVVSKISQKYDVHRTPPNGDCSITIHNISLRADNGQWQCQVTSNSLTEPALQSKTITVTVLIPPQKPRIKHEPPYSDYIRVFSNTTKEVECSVAKGNPPARIYWFLNEQNITEQSSQTDVQSDIGDPTYTSRSILKTVFHKNKHNFTLSCVAVHPLVNNTDKVLLDVYYVPIVKVDKNEYSVMEGDELRVNCKVDSNPPAAVSWKRFDTSSIVTTRRYDPSVLYFERVSRNLNKKVYVCSAKNEYGFSSPVSVTFNVLYPPHLLNASLEQSVKNGKSVLLFCNYDGNPTPSVVWFHKDPRTGDMIQIRTSKQSVLKIDDINYTEEGEYYCEGRNVIRGNSFNSKSNKIILDVYGLPAFISKTPVILEATRGSEARLTLWFCSDPQPTRAFWNYGSINLQAIIRPNTRIFDDRVNKTKRINVLPLITLSPKEKVDPAPDCYESTLLIKDVDSSDERDYLLVAENVNGFAKGLIKLKIVSPFSTTLLIAAGLVIIVIIFVIGFISLIFSKRRNKSKGGVESTKDDAQVLSNCSVTSSENERERQDRTAKMNSHELVYANLDFETNRVQKPGPPPIRPKPQIRPSHNRQINGTKTDYAKLSFPSKADL